VWQAVLRLPLAVQISYGRDKLFKIASKAAGLAGVAGLQKTALLINALASIFFALIFLSIQPSLALVAMLAVAIVLTPYFVMGERIKDWQQIEKQRDDALDNELQSQRKSLLTLQLMNRMPWAYGRLDAAANELFQAQFQSQTLTALCALIANVTEKATLVIILFLGARMVVIDNLSFGSLLAGLLLTTLMLRPWRTYAAYSVSMDAREKELQQLTPILNEGMSTARETPQLQAAPSLRTANLSYSFNAEATPLLRHINVSFDNNLLHVIYGAPGSGKSTFAYLLAGLLTPSQGAIYVQGKDLTQFHPEALSQYTGYVGAKCRLFPGTVAENIAFGTQYTTFDEIKKAAKAAGAEGFIAKLPLGYETQVNDTQMTGVQIQLLALARALLRRPKLLVLDETLSLLDNDHESRILNHAKEYLAGGTILYFTARQSSFVAAECAHVLQRGQLTQSGEPYEIASYVRNNFVDLPAGVAG
jgi:ATP-binding cassette subfamily B protein